MILAGVCYVATGTVVRHLSDTFAVFEIIFIRSVVALVMLAPLFIRTGWRGLRTSRFPLHGFRTALAYVGMMCWFYGVSRIPLADYYALQFTMPVFTIAGAVIFLGERASLRHWMAVAAGFVGVLIILRPGLVVIGIGVIAALGASLAFSAVNCCVRVLTRTDSAPVIVTYGNLLILPVSLVLALPGWIMPTWIELGWLVGVGVLGTIAQLAITRAVAVADARVVQPFDFLRLPFAAALGYVLFGEVTDVWTWAGALVIFVAGYAVLHLERTKPD